MLEFKECEKRTLEEMKEAARRLEELVKTQNLKIKNMHPK